LNVSKVAMNSSARAPGIGHNRALVDGRFGASQLMSLAQLLRGVLALGVERCSNCGAGELKIIAAIP
jgi:hypothetical protein